MNKYALLPCFILFSIFTWAQNQGEDRKQIDALIAKLYKSISFTNGEGADNEALIAIHHTEATIGSVDTAQIQIFTEKEFREKNEEVFEKNNVVSFEERELNHITHVYGGVAVRFSTYEYILKLAGREIEARGVNAFQLIKDPEKGWLIFIPTCTAIHIPMVVCHHSILKNRRL